MERSKEILVGMIGNKVLGLKLHSHTQKLPIKLLSRSRECKEKLPPEMDYIARDDKNLVYTRILKLKKCT